MIRMLEFKQGLATFGIMSLELLVIYELIVNAMNLSLEYFSLPNFTVFPVLFICYLISIISSDFTTKLIAHINQAIEDKHIIDYGKEE